MREFRDEILLRGGECETWEKRIYISENERIGNSYLERYRQNPRSFSRPRMTKRIMSLESSREI